MGGIHQATQMKGKRILDVMFTEHCFDPKRPDLALRRIYLFFDDESTGEIYGQCKIEISCHQPERDMSRDEVLKMMRRDESKILLDTGAE